MKIDNRTQPITLVEAASLFPLAYATLAQAAREGRIEARRSGATWLTTCSAIEQAIEEGKLRPRDRKEVMITADWNRYMGKHVTSEQYKANGGTLATLINDLREMWGESGPDHMTEEEISQIARELAEYADLPHK